MAQEAEYSVSDASNSRVQQKSMTGIAGNTITLRSALTQVNSYNESGTWVHIFHLAGEGIGHDNGELTPVFSEQVMRWEISETYEALGTLFGSQNNPYNAFYPRPNVGEGDAWVTEITEALSLATSFTGPKLVDLALTAAEVVDKMTNAVEFTQRRGFIEYTGAYGADTMIERCTHHSTVNVYHDPKEGHEETAYTNVKVLSEANLAAHGFLITVASSSEAGIYPTDVDVPTFTEPERMSDRAKRFYGVEEVSRDQVRADVSEEVMEQLGTGPFYRVNNPPIRIQALPQANG